MTVTIQRLNFRDASFRTELDKALAWDSISDQTVQESVSRIIADVRTRGDAAVLEWTNKLDGLKENSIQGLEISQDELQESLKQISPEQTIALEKASDRIRRYHEKQKQDSWQYTDPDGSVYGQKVSPIDKVGMYVPGGKASYPSTVLMDAIPARVAGVQEIIATLPTPGGEKNPLVLAALAMAKVDRVFTVGGAQAIAALAYGTDTIPRVDKIVGPGNIYVATAKKAVFGQVGIDMVAGPSEILVICDGKTDPDWIAMDLFSQAEHDEDAQSILVSTDSAYVEEVKRSIEKLLPEMPRRDIIKASLESRGLLIDVENLKDAAEVCNLIAPEHVELSVEDPQSLMADIKHAGAIFLGRYTSESLGDYCAGPSHVLPTSGTARFSSALGVYDFQKRSSIINCSESAARELAETASVLANAEGLIAHARAAEFRNKKQGSD
ncbi:MAG: histidinol dehydrogenase [Gammaproteobacteria bacterium]|jgi:histidinol dehydrogenase|nr:histidinol dehydrogenase [Gammaproteobacteria bacterium]MBT6043123.1 histidinol dehydrogenase [Gammaproteobacteria bacterium]